MNNPTYESKTKRLFFSLVLFSIPILFFVLVEVVLNLAGFGKDFELLHKIRIGDQTYYQVNKQVARRYFSTQDVTIPDARDGIFQKEKSHNTFRIFCLGGSTTAGFPYQYNATFPSLLNDRLELLFPEKYFEVINFGISAINSYSVLDFTKELVNYDPDLFLIYMGHNEFYGALGVASTQKIGENRNFVKFYLRMEKFKLFQLLRRVVYKIKGASKKQTSNKTLMQSVVADQVIPYKSDKFNLADENYRQNLNEIISIIRDKDIPVLTSTLVSNLKDQQPFVSIFSEDFNQQKEWDDLFANGMELYNRGEFSKAKDSFNKNINMDAAQAKAHYFLGKCDEHLGEYEKALAAFNQAKDLDALRFRASSEINEIIRNVCSDKNVPVVEMVKQFQQNSDNDLVGDNLMLEHLHPTFHGNYLLADGFLKAMAINNILAEAEIWPFAQEPSKEQQMAQAFVTDLDIEIAYHRIKRLTINWPFNNPKEFPNEHERAYSKYLENIVSKVLKSELSWNEGHYKLAEYFFKQQQFEKAEREYKAVIKVLPYNYYPYLHLGNIYFSQKIYAGAEKNYRQSLALSPQLPYVYAKLGMLYIEMQMPDVANEYLEKCIEVDDIYRKFSEIENGQAHYLNALALAQMKKYEKSKDQASMALTKLPNDQNVKSLIKKLNAVNANEN
jgi:tetratricopeptide (TPR) repeat protein